MRGSSSARVKTRFAIAKTVRNSMNVKIDLIIIYFENIYSVDFVHSSILHYIRLFWFCLFSYINKFIVSGAI